MRTGSNLLDQFKTSYIPRVFNLTLPWYVGGPDFENQDRFRRRFADAPWLTLDAFSSMIPSRVEAQMRWDWDLAPALWSLAFASKVNLGVSLGFKRFLTNSGEGTASAKDIAETAKKLYKLLWEGEYINPTTNTRQPVKGDVSKIDRIIGLTEQQKQLIKNYHFMSSRIPGTHQIRRSISHSLFAARVRLEG